MNEVWESFLFLPEQLIFCYYRYQLLSQKVYILHFYLLLPACFCFPNVYAYIFMLLTIHVCFCFVLACSFFIHVCFCLYTWVVVSTRASRIYGPCSMCTITCLKVASRLLALFKNHFQHKKGEESNTSI